MDDAAAPFDDVSVIRSPAMNPTDANAQLFADALSCSGEFPAAFSELAPESVTPARALARAEATLHSIALIEDSHAEDHDESGKDLALQRVDAKLNLVLDLLGKLARRGADALPLRTLRWSRLGVALHQPFGTAAADRGFLLIQPVGWLPQPLELPVECLASEPAEQGEQVLFLRFSPCPPSLESAIERLLFRIHRREIAVSRQR
jgi:hypothetical protein